MITKTVFIYISVCLCIVSLQAQPTPCQKSFDSLYCVYRTQKVSDSLWLQNKDYRLNRVRFYVKLVDKKPSQAKFLRGWIKRAIQ